MIIDGHTHLFSEFRGLRGVAVDDFVSDLKRQHIDGAVIFTLEGFVRENSRYYNDELYTATQAYPDYLYAFGTVHPQDGKKAEIEMRRCILELGMKGFKFHSWLQAFFACGSDMFPLVKQAIDLDVPLLFHDGTPPYSTSLQVAYLARSFPKATIILGHSGLRDLCREALFAAKKYPNIILQFCGTPPAAMQEMVREIGHQRCVFGSDYPFPGERSLDVAVSQIRELDISPEAKMAILGNNMKRLMKL